MKSISTRAGAIVVIGALLMVIDAAAQPVTSSSRCRPQDSAQRPIRTQGREDLHLRRPRRASASARRKTRRCHAARPRQPRRAGRARGGACARERDGRPLYRTARKRSKRRSGSGPSSASRLSQRSRARAPTRRCIGRRTRSTSSDRRPRRWPPPRELIKGYPAEPVDERCQGARDSGASERRPAGASRSRSRRRAEAARAAGTAALRSRAGGADAREDPAGPAVAAAEGARAVRPGAEQLAARAPGDGQRRARAPAIPICSAGRFSISASTAAARTASCWPQIYAASTDVDIKRRILRSFGVVRRSRPRARGGDHARRAPELRAEAVQQLGVMGAHDELWQLYQKESSRRRQEADPAGDVRRRQRDAPDRARQQRAESRAAPRRDPQSRAHGIAPDRPTRSSRSTPRRRISRSRKAIIQGFFTQNNAEQLVAIARKETDPEMRKEIVSRLSTHALEGGARLPDGDSEQVVIAACRRSTCPVVARASAAVLRQP